MGGGTQPAGSELVQLGGAGQDYVVALAGNPNTGKSTVFNALTGLRQHTGNWPGKTVARAEGAFSYGGRRFRLVDLPGTYSLLADSADEQIARDFILFGRPNCTVVVCDATVLERNLHLALQILQITERVVVCANLMDEADRRGVEVDVAALEEVLGVPVVPTAARFGRGLDQLIERIHAVAAGQAVAAPAKVALTGDVDAAVDELAAGLTRIIPGLPCPRWVALRLLEGDERMEDALHRGDLARLANGEALL